VFAVRVAGGWRRIVEAVIAGLPHTFTIRDVLRSRDYFASCYPENRFIDAKVRQSLQILRDQGRIVSLGNGVYSRGSLGTDFSPFYDPGLGADYVSRSQAARVSIETWAEHNLYCCACTSDDLRKLPNNEPVADLACGDCSMRYQLKSKNGRFGDRLTGAAYGPTLSAAREGSLPTYLLVEYDPRIGIVVFTNAIPGHLIAAERILPRKALSASARRAGWQGCTIDVGGLPSVRMVEPADVDRAKVRQKWSALAER